MVVSAVMPVALVCRRRKTLLPKREQYAPGNRICALRKLKTS